MDSFVHDKGLEIERFKAAAFAEIEKFKTVALAEIAATEAVISSVRLQIDKRLGGPEASSLFTVDVAPRQKLSSHSRYIVELAKQILEEEGRPIRRQEIISRLSAGGLSFPSSDLEGLVSKALSRSRQFQVAKRRYWFADRPFPNL
ncbi:hypothetical protein [Rhizobium rhizogenes]|uniref:hypothetical protein n=1 Tax=Rhizobium rhizogenes TaxID=359 RepID=UPI0015739C53|nr:hypothetical protein [Rhizobium rhizogenes]NTG08831.1 hypothetical protein [Rhizobium rhizogenes]